MHKQGGNMAGVFIRVVAETYEPIDEELSWCGYSRTKGHDATIATSITRSSQFAEYLKSCTICSMAKGE